MSDPSLRFVEADLRDPRHAADYMRLMDHFALDPMGGGKPLPADTRERLVSALLERDDVTIVLAYEDDLAVGLATCIESFSTHAARPLWNLHDMVVLDSHRGLGVGGRLLDELARRARARGYCKITLEVLEKNTRAQAVYRKAGFSGYSLGASSGSVQFWQRGLDPS